MRVIKRFLPRSLFGRWLLLLATPIVLLQLVSAFMFYQRHWDTVTRRLALGVAGEIAFLIEARERIRSPGDQLLLSDMANRHMQIAVRFEHGARLPAASYAPNRFSILDTMLTQALHERLSHPFRIDTRRSDENIEVAVELEDGLMRVLTQEKRLFSTTTYIFIMWMVGTSIVLLTIAILFLRNQVRPIKRLAQAAEAFGKGHDDEKFHPSGATEVRQAAAAFLAMRDRIRRQIAQRTEMLAGVSHDLRTPLTRMKLQLELLGDVPEAAELKRDVEEMQKMIDGYLAFARGQDGEAAVATDLNTLLGEVIAGMRRRGAAIKLLVAGDLAATVRPVALRRCLNNLIDNALRHATRVEIGAWRRDGLIEIAVDDDGPGIAPEQREAVFRPFHRLDASRNPDTGGVGLGLTIARDVARSHGGDLLLDRAPTGGLRALLRLPV